MRWTQWIWLVGCFAWLMDGLVALRLRSPQHAELAFVMATLFAIAWLFYRQSARR